MNDRQYVRSLRLFHHGEVFGEQFYGVAARMARRAETRARWEALASLERKTKQDLAAAITALAGRPREALIARGLGMIVGAALGALPEWASLRLMGALVRPALASYERFAHQGAEWNAPLAANLLAHERAQEEFLDRMNRGARAQSLEPVEALLRA